MADFWHCWLGAFGDHPFITVASRQRGHVRRNSLYYEGRPLWLGVAFIGLFGMAAAFISRRLASRHVAPNGVTLIPTWLIQVFGVILVPGMVIAFYYIGVIFFLTSAPSSAWR